MTNGNIDLGLLVLRIWFGLEMAIGHGWPKLMKIFNGDMAFADPIGVGAAVSLYLAVFAEFVCGILITLGFFTRLSLIPYLFTMLVAAFIIHADDPWGKMSYPLAYAVVAIVLLIAGPGRYSLDHRLFVRKHGQWGG